MEERNGFPAHSLSRTRRTSRYWRTSPAPRDSSTKSRQPVPHSLPQSLVILPGALDPGNRVRLEPRVQIHDHEGGRHQRRPLLLGTGAFLRFRARLGGKVPVLQWERAERGENDQPAPARPDELFHEPEFSGAQLSVAGTLLEVIEENRFARKRLLEVRQSLVPVFRFRRRGSERREISLSNLRPATYAVFNSSSDTPRTRSGRAPRNRPNPQTRTARPGERCAGPRRS